jgi:hypothetical protein
MATDRLGNYSTARLLFGAHDARKRYAACHGRMRLATRMWIMAVGLGHGRPALGMVLTSPEEIAGPRKSTQHAEKPALSGQTGGPFAERRPAGA